MLNKTSRLHRKLWHEPRNAGCSEYSVWCSAAALHLWQPPGTPESQHSRGGFSVGVGVLDAHAPDGGETCEVVTLQLHLTARHFRALCEGGKVCCARQLSCFANNLRAAAGESLSAGFYQPRRSTAVFRLHIQHLSSVVTDDQLDILSSLLWQFPAVFPDSYELDCQYFEDTWALVGPAYTVRIGCSGPGVALSPPTQGLLMACWLPAAALPPMRSPRSGACSMRLQQEAAGTL